jgi:peroxiredoxin
MAKIVSLVPVALLFFATSCLTESVQAESTDVGDFALLDHQGFFHQLSRYGDQDAVVLFVHGNGCPIARLAVPALKEVREKFSDQKVKFLMLNANVQDNLDAIRDEDREFNIDFPILVDNSQLVAELLGVKRTCEVFVINPETMQIAYRGPINDQFDYEVQRETAQHHYLADALSSVLAGEQVATQTRAVQGCLVSFPTRKADQKRGISYVKEIAPIVESRCASCHQPNGIAPFAMDSHEAVLGWSDMIRETVMTTRMPPGQVDTEFGDWSDVHFITDEEKSTLLHWIDAGAPKDGDEDPLTKIVGRPETRWPLGEPDLIVDIPPQEVPATGIVDYIYVTLPLGLEEEKWVSGYEFYIDNPAVVHHITTSTVIVGEEDDDQNPNDSSRTGFAGFAPGNPRLIYPENVGYRVGPGSAIRASLHYTPNGKAVTDHSKIGLYFRDNEPDYEIRRWSPGNAKFVIPPHDGDVPVRAERLVKHDTHLFNLQPHMHVRGKRVSYTAIFPDGTERKLLSVPNYQFNWQMIYTPKEPIFLPKGTTMVVEGAFDNSSMNLTNPDPSQEVRWGDQSWDEMFLGHTQIAAPKTTDVAKE